MPDESLSARFLYQHTNPLAKAVARLAENPEAPLDGLQQPHEVSLGNTQVAFHMGQPHKLKPSLDQALKYSDLSRGQLHLPSGPLSCYNMSEEIFPNGVQSVLGLDVPMRNNPRIHPHKWSAEFYDQFFTVHFAWVRGARKHILGKILRKVRVACNLACGTGTTALTLAHQGIRMYAVDLSPTLCRLARERAHKARVPVRVLRADMRNFRLPETVDLVLCEFEALNHLPRKSDLVRVLRAVSRALRPGGYFYFDVNNCLAFQKVWPTTYEAAGPGVALVLHAGYEVRQDKGHLVTEWYVRNGRRWHRVGEPLEEVCWTRAEICRSLRQAGFGSIRSWDGTRFGSDDALMHTGYRTFYLARKSL